MKQPIKRAQVPFDKLVSQLVDPAFVIGAEGRVLVWNRACELLTGMLARDVVGTHNHWRAFYDHERPCLADLIAQEQTARITELYAATDSSLMSYGGWHAQNWCAMPLRGVSLYLAIDAGPIRNEAGELIAVVETLRDWTSWKNTESQLRLIESVFASSSEGIIITDANVQILQVNPAFTALTGYAPDEVHGRNPSLLQSGIHDRSFYRELWKVLLEHGHWSGEVWNRRKSGEIYPESLSINAVRDPGGKVTHYVGMFSDITAQKQAQDQLEDMAKHDALTGLPNRIALSARLHQVLSMARSQNHLVAVCFVDLDEFKPINDTYGHEAGDQVLIEVSQRLKSATRSSDTVARIGGDEFIILLADFSTMEEIEQALGRILEILRQPIVIGTATVAVSASIGVTVHPLDESDTDTLIRHADQAMYVAKNTGRNNWRMYDASDDQETTLVSSTLSKVRDGLQHGEFRIFYQPKVNMRTGRVVGLEALLRWQHPERGLVPPGEFLPHVENSPLIVDLGEWVIHEVLQQIVRWQAADLSLRVSVNIAARQFQHIDFVMRLRSILAQYPGVSPSLLEIEVLESTAFDDVENVRAVLLACQEMGVVCALDDFGTGYSTLTYLRRVPARELKIDQTFIRDMLEDQEDLALVEGIIGLAQVFHMGVVAEGVETREHGIVLMRVGCDVVQGYYIAKPMPGDDVLAWCTDFRPQPAWQQWAAATWDRSHLPLVLAEYDHLKWVQQLVASLDHPALALPPTSIAGGDGCRFCHWLAQQGQHDYGHLGEYRDIGVQHARIHEIATIIERLRADGDSEQARVEVSALMQAKDAIVGRLAQLHSALLDTDRIRLSV
jgi:diguanylate cyclase (GGDEF)-like protein/PAS domain S-box-containing protein